jgi:hypothetical protein
MKDETFVVTGNTAAAAAGGDHALEYPSLTSEFLQGLLGNPFDVFSMTPRPRPAVREEEEYEPRTELGGRLWEIRKRVIAAGRATMTWDDIERELSELRGER